MSDAPMKTLDLFDDPSTTLRLVCSVLRDMGARVSYDGEDGVVSRCEPWRNSHASAETPDDRVLFVVRSTSLETCAHRHPGATMLALGEGDGPSLAPDMRKCTILAFFPEAEPPDEDLIAARIAYHLVAFNAWTTLLDSLKPPKTLHDFIECGGKLLKAPLCLVDDRGSLMASSAPSDMTQCALEDAARFEELDRPSPARVSLHSLPGSAALIAPLQAMGKHHGAAYLLFPEGAQPDQKTIAAFEAFSSRCAHFVARHVSTPERLEERQAALVSLLLKHEKSDKAKIEREAADIELKVRCHYRVILIDGPHNTFPSARSLMLSTLRTRFPDCLPLEHDGQTVILAPEANAGMKIGSERIGELEALCSERQCRCYASDAVESLHVLWYAYGEAQAAKSFRRNIDLARAPWKSAGQPDSGVYQFYEAVTFFSPIAAPDLDFLNKSYRAIPLQSVMAHDAENKGDDLPILYCYLSLGEKTQAVATRMCMHRNNIRYRIDQIKRRYSFDLDDHFVRSRLLNDFQLMIAQSKEFRENLEKQLG